MDEGLLSMDRLKSCYINLKRYSDQLNKDYPKLMREDFREDKWLREGKKIEENMKKFERALREVRTLMEKAKDQKDSDDTIISKVEELLETIDQTSEPNLRAMKDKVGQFNFDIGVNEEPEEDDQDDQEQGQIELNLMENKEIIEQRGKELKNIYKISAIINDTTKQMSQKLNEQGEVLVNIEQHIDKASENVEDAHNEITKADEMSKGNNKKMIIIIVIVVVVVAVVLAIAIPVGIKNSKKNK